MKKVAFYTLGCKLNFSESSTIARNFEEKGYQKVNFEDTPHIYVINTCSVTENANKKCKSIVNKALKISPEAYIVIIGCYAQLKPNEISKIPGVDAVLGASEKFKLIELLDGFEKSAQPKIMACEIINASSYNHAYSINDRTRTFLKIQDGCDYNCTFCTIPLARGKSRSQHLDKIIEEAEHIVNNGVKEIVLTGVNTGDYGIINKKKIYRFTDLVNNLSKIERLERLRISSIEPNLLSEEIIDLAASNSSKLLPHFHIPLQSGSDIILKKMKRRYLSAHYENLVNKIKEKIPHCSIGADVMVGFPGESTEEFNQTYHFIKQLDVSYLHVFTYSERENTEASVFKNSIPYKIREERSKILRNLSYQKKKKFYEEHLGKNEKVLFENEVKNKKLSGYTSNYIKVETPYESDLINQIKKVRLDKINDDDNVEVTIMNPSKKFNQICH